MSPDHQSTDTARSVWAAAGDYHAAIVEAHRMLEDADHELHRAIMHAGEMPTAEALRWQALRALDLVSATRSYYREVRHLYALAGGDVWPGMGEAP